METSSKSNLCRVAVGLILLVLLFGTTCSLEFLAAKDVAVVISGLIFLVGSVFLLVQSYWNKVFSSTQ